MEADQTRPAAAYSQPIGLAGRRRVRTSPMVANSSQKEPSKAPLTTASVVSGRTTNRVTTSPPSRQGRVAAKSSQACRVRVLGRTPPTVGGVRYGTVTAHMQLLGEEALVLPLVYPGQYDQQ